MASKEAVGANENPGIEPGSAGNGLPPLPRQPKPGECWPLHHWQISSREGQRMARVSYFGDGAEATFNNRHPTRVSRGREAA